MKVSIIAFLMILCLSLAPATVSAHGSDGGGGGNSASSIGSGGEPQGFISGGSTPSVSGISDAMDVAEQTAALDSLNQQLSAKKSAADEHKDGAKEELLDILRQINKRADQIEAEVSDLESRYKSDLLRAKINKLKAYVANIRSQAREGLENIQ